MTDHPYGWLSLAPPVATVLLAIITKRAVLSLLAGLVVGALILTGGDPIATTIEVLESHLWATLSDPWQIRLFGFLVLIGAMIGVVNRSGGMHGLVGLITPLAKTRRSGQLATWLAGLVVFFDDYTNTLLVGATMQSTCDRLRISREKLAYLVDSTAAPVAGIALLSTWVAVELDYIEQGLKAVDPALLGDYNKLNIFMGCIPYRFYIIQALLFVPIIALAGRDFGPMRWAEQATGANPITADDAAATTIEATHWINAVVPLGVTLAVVIALLIQTGLSSCREAAVLEHAVATDRAVVDTSVAEIQQRLAAVQDVANEATVDANKEALFEYAADNGLLVANLPEAELDAFLSGYAPTAQEIFGAADTSLALFYGALLGLGVAWLMATGKRILTSAQASDAAFAGTRAIVPGMLILLLATTMSAMTRGDLDRDSDNRYPQAATRLYTGDYLQSLLPEADEEGVLSQAIAYSLPTVVFVMASIVAFSTGTSYGTMGILFPVIAPIAFATLGPTAGSMASEPMLLATFGAVLSGAIFGDHCSPISDTTVLSSQASGCDHVQHVVTQLPYALTVAAVCTLLGTLPLSLGVSVWVLLPLQTVALVAIAYVVGKPIDRDAG